MQARIAALAGIGLAALMLGTGCARPTAVEDPPIDDPCLRGTTSTGYYLHVSIHVSADSVPVITWSPAACGVALLSVNRIDDYSATCGWAEICYQDTRAWVVAGGDAAPLHPPVRYGIVPDSSAAVLEARPIAVGSRLQVTLSRPWRQGPHSGDAAASLIFVVGQGFP